VLHLRMKTRNTYLLGGYAVLVLVYLIGLYVFPPQVQLALKSLLIPVLIVLVAVSIVHLKLLLLGTLYASWIGDIVISYADIGDIYFLGGIFAFFVAQVGYIFLFKNSIRIHPQNRGYHVSAWTAQFIALGVFLVLLLPKLGYLTVPILVYAAAISLMLVLAIKGWAHWPIDAANWVVAGAASFVVSDLLLALNRFYTPIPHAQLGVMATYAFAQGALVYGLIKVEERREWTH
jgi:uncharacterized membrane protein YhhN